MRYLTTTIMLTYFIASSGALQLRHYCYSPALHPAVCHLTCTQPALQANNVRTSWDAVWAAPEEIAKEGIMISPHLLDDHYTATLEVRFGQAVLCRLL